MTRSTRRRDASSAGFGIVTVTRRAPHYGWRTARQADREKTFHGQRCSSSAPSPPARHGASARCMVFPAGRRRRASLHRLRHRRRVGRRDHHTRRRSATRVHWASYCLCSSPGNPAAGSEPGATARTMGTMVAVLRCRDLGGRHSPESAHHREHRAATAGEPSSSAARSARSGHWRRPTITCEISSTPRDHVAIIALDQPRHRLDDESRRRARCSATTGAGAAQAHGTAAGLQRVRTCANELGRSGRRCSGSMHLLRCSAQPARCARECTFVGRTISACSWTPYNSTPATPTPSPVFWPPPSTSAIVACGRSADSNESALRAGGALRAAWASGIGTCRPTTLMWDARTYEIYGAPRDLKPDMNYMLRTVHPDDVGARARRSS